MLLSNGTLEEATLVAERIRRNVEQHCSPAHDSLLERGITVSLGVAPLTRGTQTLEELLAAADRQMYHAKKAGKNRVSAAGVA